MKQQIKGVFVFGIAMLFGAAHRIDAAPLIAVFDPQKTATNTMMVLDTKLMDDTASLLQKHGFEIGRVTTAQIQDAAQFNAQKYAVLVLQGESVPREDFASIKKFAQDGGVLVALASKNPFNKGVTRSADGQWSFSPSAPDYSWQTTEITDVFGFQYRYRPSMLDSGSRHTATPLLKKYLPNATDYMGVLPSTWVVPASGGTFYPLMRSQRADGHDVPPQIYIARKEGRSAVISAGDLWTKGGDGWNFGEQTTVALVKIALDLQSGALKPTDADKVEIPDDLAPAEPLTTRIVQGQVNPDNAPVVTRWGKFDGSGLELSDKTALPRFLSPGASVTLALKQNGKPLWLRVRGAVSQSGATLKVAVGDQVEWNESIAYAEVPEVGNFGTLSLSNVPVEFMRRVFLPPTNSKTIVVSNPGTQRLYFDAVQLENEPVKPIQWLTGMGAAQGQIALEEDYNLPSKLANEWTGLRSTLWLFSIGPPEDPKRWDILEKRIAAFRTTGRPLEVLIESTPEWAAINPERYAAAGSQRATPPDPEKYKQIVDYVLKHHASEIASYEIWNEEDSKYFWEGSAQEFVALWRAVVPMIRKSAPHAPVILGGLTGFDKKFLETLAKENVLREADLVAFHPYAGSDAAWDKPYGTIQGQLYSLGQNNDIYNNEIGFPSAKSDWFPDAKFPYTLATQARMTDVGLARLLASNVSKFSIYQSGGTDGGFSYVNGKGEPTPAYRVLQDYFKLSRGGGRRLDIAMSRSDGMPQTGVYLAGSVHPDRSVTVVINPAEVVPPKFDAPDPDIAVPLVLRVPLAKSGRWKAQIDGADVPIAVNSARGQTWGEITFTLHKRSVLTVAP